MALDDIVVSVCMITYNHEQYISQAIDGILAQRTDFRFELIISDDCSSDNTRAICSYYHERHPDTIRLLFRESNLGICNNYFDTISRAKGKYIAICEGDDYWTDVYKLEKQKGYLQSHPTASMIYHNAIIDNDGKKDLFIKLSAIEHIVTTEEMLNKWAIPTASIMFRREAFFIPSPFIQFTNADYYLELLLMTKGTVVYIPSIMSVYRQHADSASSHLNKDRIRLYSGIIELLGYCKSFYDGREDQALFDCAVQSYQQKLQKEERDTKYPFLKFFDWRFYKRAILKKFRLTRAEV